MLVWQYLRARDVVVGVFGIPYLHAFVQEGGREREGREGGHLFAGRENAQTLLERICGVEWHGSRHGRLLWSASSGLDLERVALGILAMFRAWGVLRHFIFV